MKKLFSLFAAALLLPLSMFAADDAIELSVSKVNATQWMLTVNLENPNTAYTGFQMDVQLPDGASFDYTTLTGTSRLSNVTLRANEHTPGLTRVIGYATLRTSKILQNTGAICTMLFNTQQPLAEGEYSIVAKNVRVTTSASAESLLPGITYTFSVQQSEGYTVTYYDGETVFATANVAVGDTIPTADEPTAKEGYTFCGWGDVPAAMPDHNVDLHAVWCPIHYTVTYTSGNDVIHTEQVPYGSPLPDYKPTPIEGHNFCGWSEAPATMPAHDITLGATWCVISYKLSYVVSGEVVHTENVEYGAPLPEYFPDDKKDYVFEGWIEAPERMPAADLELEASFRHRADVNGDSLINALDVVNIYNYVLVGAESGMTLKRVDVNQDGSANASDVVTVYNYVIGSN